jgi:nicotinate-nucleotide pyrophosphorylase (carboxylating)
MYDVFQTDRLIDLWLTEDIGYCQHAARIFKRYDPTLEVSVRVKDGDKIERGTVMLDVSGTARSVLTAERTALNIVQRLSGIANLTEQYVAAVAGTKVRLIDTRKTTPGLRMLEKHAVTCGGGLNHRLGLDNGVMIKDNHIAVCGGIAKAVQRARKQLPVLTKLEVECESLEQVKEALAANVDVIMLDNMSVEDMTRAVEIVSGRVLLEASGGISLATIGAIAKTGVDYISTSKINQAAACVDIGLDEAE